MTSTENKPPKLTGSQDLLSYFNLLPIYNRFVRPYPPPNRAAELNASLYPYLSNLPGVVDIEPDNYLMTLLHDPQANESGPEIKPLDQDTLRDSFSLKLGPVPGFDSSILGMDDGGGSSGQGSVNHDHHQITLRTTVGEGSSEMNGERKHKKKKKKRKHSHENEDETGSHSHSEHKKKKKRKKERDHERRRDENEGIL